MTSFEDAMVKVLEMAQLQQRENPRPVDESWPLCEVARARFDHRQECLDVVEDFIVNQLGED